MKGAFLMTVEYARQFISAQENNIKRLDNLRITKDGYEYRISYHGGFASYFAIDRREIGKRNFKYFGGVGGYDCFTAQAVLKKILEKIS